MNSHKIITEIIPPGSPFIWSMNLFDLEEDIPAHYHQIQTQLITILEGSLEIHLSDRTITLTTGGYISIPPYTPHAFSPKDKVRFLTIDFPGFHFPHDVYSDVPHSKETQCFIFQGEHHNRIDAQTKLNRALLDSLVQSQPLSSEFYLEKFSHSGVNAYTLAQEDKKWSIAILDVQEAPEHYHKIETEHFIVLNGELGITLNGVAHHLLPGQSVHLPPHTHHLVKSALSTPVRLLCLNFPAFDLEDFYDVSK